MNSKAKPNLNFESIVDEAIMGIMAFSNASKQCVYANNIAKEFLGFPEDKDISDIKLTDLFPERTVSGYKTLNIEVLKLEGLHQDIVVRKLSGMNFMANLGVKLFTEHKEKHILVMFQDITFQKKLQKEINLKQKELKIAYEDLLAQNRQLKELDLAKDRFINLTTHELRTPVSAIVATCDTLVNKLYDNESQKDQFISSISEQSLRLMELVNDILDFAKIQTGKLEYYVEQKDLIPLVQNSIAAFQGAALKKDVEILFQPRKNNVLCYFDEVRLTQVLANILSNAIKFNRNNGTITLSLSKDESTNSTILSIEDTGQGIENDKINKIFDEFETISDVSRHHQGTGLGMPISKKIIESLGGKIKVTSKFNVGTKFEVYIPNAKVLDLELYRPRPDFDGDLVA